MPSGTSGGSCHLRLQLEAHTYNTYHTMHVLPQWRRSGLVLVACRCQVNCTSWILQDQLFHLVNGRQG